MDYHGARITVPSKGEILRIKGVLILKRNATRDYLDFLALADHMGEEDVALALQSFDRLYQQASGESPIQQMLVQLANAQPYDLEETKPGRSEEHTSELQSLMRISYAVFCLQQHKDTYKTASN